MEFLNNAIVSKKDKSLLGALITQFSPDNYRSRASIKFYTTADLIAQYDSFTPRGFIFDKPGNLRSDSVVCQDIAESALDYMKNECGQFHKQDPDLIDFMLFGVVNQGCWLPTYSEQEMGVMLPFSSFTVSASSFNIYAGYLKEDKGFRTCSLLDSWRGDSKEMFAAFPGDVSLDEFVGTHASGTLAFERDVEVDDMQFKVYRVNLGLNCFYASVGEAFLNFLAYNVAFYNIGEKLMKRYQLSFSPETKTALERKPTERKSAKERQNIAIEHIFKEERHDGIIKNMRSSDELLQYFRDYPEAIVTYQWMQKIFDSPWYARIDEDKPEEYKLYSVSMNMLPQCRKDRLKYALELLSHRYYIYRMGIGNDFLGPILKGGGVDGESIKRVSFW